MIVGAGFALMAWRLSLRRVFPDPLRAAQYMPERMTERCTGAAECCECCEYFNILDEAHDRFRSREDNGYTVYL
jgi:hypothetical protein